MRRLFWALVGIGLGAVLGIALVRWAERTKQRLSPTSLARGAQDRATSFATRWREAVEVGRRAMEEREAELRAELGLRDF